MYGLAGGLMFTGLIEQKGLVLANDSSSKGNRLVIGSPFNDLETGESIAINGVCLTVLPSESQGMLNFDLSPETLRLTTLAELALGDEVNLERAMRASTRFGGHYVSGHVDTRVTVKSIHSIGEFVHVELTGFNQDELLYLIVKGSIAVEGVSLTINAVNERSIQLMLVPHTLVHTTLSTLKIGQYVNIEFDYFTRIVAHQLRLLGGVRSEVEV
jgi:riboflavin synthase